MNKNFTIERVIKIILVLLILIIALIAALSFFVFEFTNTNRPIVSSDLGNGDRDENKINFPAQETIILPKILYNLSGRITEIGKDAITFNAAILSKKSNGEIVNDAESRKANVGSAAVIKKLVFVKNSPVESVISFGDLKVGDYIEIISDQDISTSLEFTATQITVLP